MISPVERMASISEVVYGCACVALVLVIVYLIVKGKLL
jgi:hypothetical protein